MLLIFSFLFDLNLCVFFIPLVQLCTDLRIFFIQIIWNQHNDRKYCSYQRKTTECKIDRCIPSATALSSFAAS